MGYPQRVMADGSGEAGHCASRKVEEEEEARKSESRRRQLRPCRLHNSSTIKKKQCRMLELAVPQRC